MTLLFRSVSNGDEKTFVAIIKEFLPGIKRIATKVKDQYELTD